MKPIDPTKPVPPSVATIWDYRGIRFDRDERDPDEWWYDLLFRCVDDWDALRRNGPYYTAPPQDWTWTDNIRPDTDYYAETERVHHPFKMLAGVCRSSADGESLVFEDGSKADRHNDIVREAFPLAHHERLSLPTTAVLDLLFKTRGLGETKSDLLSEVKKTYEGPGSWSCTWYRT